MTRQTRSTRRTRRTFGAVRRLPSGRYQASYLSPDGLRRTHAETFTTKGDADGWLAGIRVDLERGDWRPAVLAAAPAQLLEDYAESWLAGRDLKPRTRAEYAAILRLRIRPTFGRTPVGEITPAAVRKWHAALGASTGPTARAHAYGLLRTILGTAVADDLIPANPCRVRGGGSSKRVKRIRPATLGELEAIVAAIAARYRAMVLLAAWCALRFGELTELRRGDVDLKAGRLRIRRGVTRTAGAVHVGTPKSDAGIRDVAIPPHLIPVLRAHLAEHTGRGRDALLFPAADGVSHMAPATLYRVWYPARDAADRPDLRFHDLRHTGAVLAAATGATLAELMARLGHSTPAAAMRYQHASADRDQVIADALSQLAIAAPVIPIGTARRDK